MSQKRPKTRALLTPLEIYFREINRTPLLTAAQEKALAHRIQAGDPEARDLMVRANLRLVVRLACRYARRGCCLEDLIAEGNVGLLKAADRYNPARNTRFSTYAFYWIRLAIQQGANAVKTIRLSNHMAHLTARWSRTTAQLWNELGRSPTPEEIARRLDLPPERIPAVQHALHINRLEPRSLDGDTELPLADFLLDDQSHGPEETAGEDEVRRLLAELLGDLSDREAQVLRLRFGLNGEEAHTLQAIAARLGVTRERVRQIETRALCKLRSHIESAARTVTLAGDAPAEEPPAHRNRLAAVFERAR